MSDLVLWNRMSQHCAFHVFWWWGLEWEELYETNDIEVQDWFQSIFPVIKTMKRAYKLCILFKMVTVFPNNTILHFIVYMWKIFVWLQPSLFYWPSQVTVSCRIVEFLGKFPLKLHCCENLWLLLLFKQYAQRNFELNCWEYIQFCVVLAGIHLPNRSYAIAVLISIKGLVARKAKDTSVKWFLCNRCETPSRIRLQRMQKNEFWHFYGIFLLLVLYIEPMNFTLILYFKER